MAGSGTPRGVEVAEVIVTGVAAGGDGVARLDDGAVVFVPRTAPGDRVRIGVLTRKRRFARGRLLEVLEPAPGRIEPKCRHYDGDQCGACQLQHIDYPTQLAIKSRIVGDALRRIGGIDVPDPPVQPASRQWSYRVRIRLARDGTGRLGYRRLQRPDEIFQLERCEIASERLRELWSALLDERHLLPDVFEGIVLAEDVEGDLHVMLEDPDPAWDSGPLANGLGSRARVWTSEGIDHRPLVFRQTDAGPADSIRHSAVSFLGKIDGEHVWDLYCGSGETTRLLLEGGARVSAVDKDRAAASLADAMGPGVRAVAARAEDITGDWDRPVAVVTNPPRSGMDGRLTGRLARMAESGPLRVAYISCDPATLARDLKRMPHLAVRSVYSYDLFPQTAHVETLVKLESDTA